MADSRFQLKCERWVREEWLCREFGTEFREEQVVLSSGGTFKFDAVSTDKSIVAVVSTSNARTGTRKLATGKMHKIRSDLLFLLLANPVTPLVVLTERDMFDYWLREQARGRAPKHIRFIHVPLPADFATELLAVKNYASAEVSPRKP